MKAATLKAAVGVLVLLRLCDAAAITYKYDSLNRLTTTIYPDGTTLSYSYDSAGNRLSQIVSSPASPTPQISVDQATLSFTVAAGQTSPSQIVSISNVGGGTLQWDAAGSANWLNVTPASGTNSGAVSVTASAATLGAGTYNGTITVLASASNAPFTVPVTLTVTGVSGNPAISSNGIVSAAGSVQGLTRGSIGTIYGSALADAPLGASTVPLPRLLRNVQVAVDGVNAPLWYVGPGQINFQVPFESPLQGTASVVVTRDGVAGAPFSLNLVPYAPSVFTYSRTADVSDPIIVHAADQSLVTPTNPAVAGEYVIAYGTGIGDLTTLPTTGGLSPSQPLAQAMLAPIITIGGVKAPVTFAGLTPDTIGLAQFNIQVPPGLPSGNTLPLIISFGSASSEAVQLYIGGNTAPSLGTVLSVTGPPVNNGTGIFPSNPLAFSFTVGQSYSNVSISADLVGNFSGTAYLMNQIGVGTTAANQIATGSFTSAGAPFGTMQVVLQNVSLVPGTFYLVLSTSQSNLPQGLQETNSPVIVSDVGASTNGQIWYSSSPAGYVPASGFGLVNGGGGAYAPEFTVVAGSPSSPVLSDTLSGTVVDSTKWNAVVSPAGAGTIVETNQGLQMQHTQGGVVSYLGLQSLWKVHGDFDVQVDYKLLNWPAQNYHTVRISAPDLPEGPLGVVGIYRNSYQGEDYQMRAASGVVADVSTTDLAGTMRIVRTGTTLSCYYLSGGQFISLGSTQTTTQDTRVMIDFSNPDTSQASGDQIAFQNFRVNSGSIVSP